MSYINFVTIYLFLPATVLFFASKKRGKLWLIGLLIHLFIALIYTIPWDSFLIKNDIWYYDRNYIFLTIFSIPLGEYFFMILQTILVCLIIKPEKLKFDNKTKLKFSLTGGIIALCILLAGLLAFQYNKSRYLSLILLWAAFPLGIQLTFGLKILKDNIIWISTYCLPMSCYFSVIDSFALGKIWTISDKTSLGIKIGNIPIEESLFFLFTTLFILNGMCLWFRFTKDENC